MKELKGKCLGLALRGRRAELDAAIDQAYLATHLGIGASYISLMERGKRPVSEDHLGPWCELLGVSVAEIKRRAKALEDTNRGRKADRVV